MSEPTTGDRGVRTPHLKFTMIELERSIKSININHQVTDDGWDSIIRTLNSDFSPHNVKTENICDGVKRDMNKAISRSVKINKWQLLEMGGYAAVIAGLSYVVSILLIEVVGYVGG